MVIPSYGIGEGCGAVKTGAAPRAGRSSPRGGDPAAAAWFTAEAGRPQAERDPPPLLTGADLLAAGIPAGPALGDALARARVLQLDGAVTTKAEALTAILGG